MHAQLFFDITEMIEEAAVTIQRLKKRLTFFADLRIPLQDADTITDVMKIVQQHTSFTNCTYLETVVNCVNIPAAKREIDAYYSFVEHFCQHKLQQHSYVASLLANRSKHLHYSETITFKLQWNPVEKTLADIRSTLGKTFDILANYIHVKQVKGGCVMVICYAPQYLMGALVKLAQENMKVLVESSVTYLSVGYAVVLDNRAQEKVK